MAVLTENAFSEAERRTLSKPLAPAGTLLPRLALTALRASRAAVLVFGAIAVALAPEPWLRSLLALGVLLLVYGAGYQDGRRDLATDLVRGARRAPVSPPGERAEESGG